MRRTRHTQVTRRARKRRAVGPGGYALPVPAARPSGGSNAGWKEQSSNWQLLTPAQRKAWPAFRKAYLRDHPWCTIGYTDICQAVANTVDHLDGCDYRTQFLDRAWCRAACVRCHRRRTAQQGNAAQAQAGRRPTVTKSQTVNKPKPTSW